MDKKIPKGYEPSEVEKKWSEWWEEQGFFSADTDSEKSAFSVVIPPPNVTGRLHMGHALNITLQDIMVRWKRMEGANVLWLPGTDHAGIATQNVVERQLATEGKNRANIGREKFEELVWEWKEKSENHILNQIRRLGSSCDWSRKRFTLDEGLSSAVREVFIQLYEEGLIYRGEYIVNWCPRCTTAISDLEVEYKSISGKLWYIKYPLGSGEDSLVVATTRPETMLGDTAIAVHPEDIKYVHLKNQYAVLPLVGRELPVVADSLIDREFGTGAVKVTPGHDPFDFEVGQRFKLPIVKVIGEDGRMTRDAGKYANMDRYKARKSIVSDLKEKGFLVKVEDHDHNIGHCQRCDTVIEPLVSRQWFVKIKTLAKPAIRAVEDQRTVFFPKSYERVYFEWMHKIHDWCISRQLWWGHRIPAWYCRDCEETIVVRETPKVCPSCGSESVEQEHDVLDTWFSSALWPFSTLGWPESKRDLEVYYPTGVLVTGFDIIFFWVARMMMMGLRFMGDVPFRKVLVHGLVRDEQGRKMSKTVGNVIDPLKIMDKYGTDAMRFTLAIMAAPGTDVPFSVSRMAGYRAFCNKIWNAGRFLLLNLGNRGAVSQDKVDQLLREDCLDLEHRWILSRTQRVISDTRKNLSKFRFHECCNQLYHFFWHEFCDWFVELSKKDLISRNSEKRTKTSDVVLYVMEVSLRLLHPFIPFITEEIWQQLPHAGRSLVVAEYPSVQENWIDPEAEEQMGNLQELITAVRTVRSENNIDPRKKVPVQIICNSDRKNFLKSQLHHLLNLARLKTVDLVSNFDHEGLRVNGVSSIAEFSIFLDEVIDVTSERQRLGREVRRTQANVERLQSKLENSNFIQKAPERIVNLTREQHTQAVEQLIKLQGRLEVLS